MSTERRLAELERRVLALSNTIRSSPGASTAGGAEFIRAPQMGFPAKLTSVYNATTGYNWEMRTLTSSGGVQDAGLPLTGTRAWEVAGRTDLASGSYVWLEPAPTGQGYLFYSPASTAPTATTAPATSTSISVDDTWVDITAASLTVPATGYYLFNWAYVGRANVTTGTPAKLLFQILSAGFKVAEREYTLHVTGEDVSFALACSKWEYLLSGTLKMQARRVSGVTWSSVDVYNTAGPGETFVQIVDF